MVKGQNAHNKHFLPSSTMFNHELQNPKSYESGIKLFKSFWEKEKNVVKQHFLLILLFFLNFWKKYIYFS